MPLRATAGGEQKFTSPEEAVEALTQAARAQDTNAMQTIFGPDARDLVSRDAVQASNALAVFIERVTNKVALDPVSSDTVVLRLGWDAWPFPIPLVKTHSKWMFDTKAGREEILNRRIGEDELAVISVCHSYVDAQREYASQLHDGGDVLEFAQHLRSSPGKHDGLYWHAEPDEDPSPLGPLISEAHAEGYSHENKILAEPQNPYHGYYFKILTRQGSHAPAGKYDYLINGHLIGGFALIAWPAEWGNTGVMSFIVNQQDQVYQKNLGHHTDSLARHMKTYDPDPSWQLAGSP
ncbi:MAG TPA: DUF2950 domain-containing protein [Verrucomicrobiae bacterium]|nr:DUF2950 domain-containing protein [Verrucomicrobiae bacterium]